MIETKSLLSEGNISFYQLSNVDGKTWLIPEKNMATAMQLYQPSGWKGVILKKMFPILHHIPLARKAAHAIKSNYVLNAKLLSNAQSAFHQDNLEYSIFGGTPSVHQKVTIQFHNVDKIFGYGKVTDNHDVEKLFYKEQTILDYLHERGISNVPRCLMVRKLDESMTFFLQTSEKKKGSFSPNGWTPLHEQFLVMLAKSTAVTAPFHESDFYKNITAVVKYLPYLSPEHERVISAALDTVLREFGTETYVFTSYHGDFTPWNMFVNDNRLFVFDWEYAELTYPPMLDRYHFFVQQYIHVGHLSTDEINRRIKNFEWYVPSSFRCYLLDIISRFVCREKGQVSKDLSAKLNIWTSLLQKLPTENNG